MPSETLRENLTKVTVKSSDVTMISTTRLMFPLSTSTQLNARKKSHESEKYLLEETRRLIAYNRRNELFSLIIKNNKHKKQNTKQKQEFNISPLCL